MVDKNIYPIKQQFVSSFFPSLFLLGQTGVSPPVVEVRICCCYWHTRSFRSNKQICWSDSTEAFELWRTLACYLNTFLIKISAIIKVTLISWLTISMQQEFEPNIRLQRKVLSNLWCLQKNGIGDWLGF